MSSFNPVSCLKENPTGRAPLTRPVHKLSVGLVDTYKLINKRYYERKKKRLREKSERESGEVNEYDDENYDYIIHLEEVMMDRYTIKRNLGKGSFGQVIEVYDKEREHNVAVKIIKSKRSFMDQAQTEIKLLNELKANDPKNESGTVRLLDTFVFRGHQCLVFELLSVNLYELLKNTGFKGVSLNLTRKFARQIMRTLVYMATLPNPIIHCDLKPENILLCHPRKSTIKVADFGSACHDGDPMYTYIQSRFYRSPEVMMGLPYDNKIDMWSLGCILVELHTGEPLFKGKNTHDQMRRVIELFGMVPQTMVDESHPKNRTTLFVETDGQLVFKHLPIDQTPVDGDKKAEPRSLSTILGAEIGGPDGRRQGEAGHAPANYAVFIDLIKKMLQLDPALRITPEEALKHDFFKDVENPVQGDASTGASVGSASEKK